MFGGGGGGEAGVAAADRDRMRAEAERGVGRLIAHETVRESILIG